jgi:chromosome condensin MukBEF MukE localization factor
MLTQSLIQDLKSLCGFQEKWFPQKYHNDFVKNRISKKITDDQISSIIEKEKIAEETIVYIAMIRLIGVIHLSIEDLDDAKFVSSFQLLAKKFTNRYDIFRNYLELFEK